MRRKFRGGLAVVAGLCFAAIAMAQPPAQPGQGGSRFGRGGPPGGPGVGMIGGGGGFGTSRLSLLRIAEVRKELELDDEQVKAITQLDEELRAKYPFGRPPGGPGGPGGGPGGEPGRRGPTNNEGALRNVPQQWFFVQQTQPAQPGQQGQPGQPGRGRGGFQPPSPEQVAEMEKQRAERDREANAKLAEYLLPNQIKRLNEIFVQQAGVAALFDEEVAKELGISAAQKAKLAEVRQQNQDASSAAMREMFQPGGGGDRDAARAKFEELRKANDAKIVAVLSADQQKKFEEMKGKPFAMPEGAGRFGPGGPGRGPGGPGGTRERSGSNN